MITLITDAETRLTNTLRTCTEALQAVTAERDDLSKLLHQALDERDHYINERDALKADAERYRWLRSRVPGGTYRVIGVVYSEGGEGVDEAIDLAMKGTS